MLIISMNFIYLNNALRIFDQIFVLFSPFSSENLIITQIARKVYLVSFKKFIFVIILIIFKMTTATIDSIDLIDLTDLTQKTQKKNKGGRPSSSIWKDINKGKSIGSGKFAASCKYCDNTWPRGDVPKLEEHFSNHCSGASAAVIRKYMAKVVERQDKKPSKKRKLSGDG